MPFRARRGRLALRQPEDLVVEHDVGHIVVLAGGVHEVVATDAVAVTVTAGGDYLDAGIGDLCCSGDR